MPRGQENTSVVGKDRLQLMCCATASRRVLICGGESDDGRKSRSDNVVDNQTEEYTQCAKSYIQSP